MTSEEQETSSPSQADKAEDLPVAERPADGDKREGAPAPRAPRRPRRPRAPDSEYRPL